MGPTRPFPHVLTKGAAGLGACAHGYEYRSYISPSSSKALWAPAWRGTEVDSAAS